MVKKPKNKSNGEGSIYKRKDGRWVGQYTIGTGRMSKTRHIYGKTQSDVRVKLTKALADRDSGLLFNADSMTMDRYLDGWLKSSMKDAVKPVTYDSYKRLVHRHIIPALGATSSRT